MKRTSKKMISGILAAVMLFALLPAGIVGAVESAPVEYVFSGPAIGLEDGTAIKMKSGSAADDNGKGMNDIVSTISAPWDLLAYRSCTGGRYRPEGISCNTKGTLGIAFSIEVKEKGTFIPTVHFDYAERGVIVSVYVFDEATRESQSLDMGHQDGIKNTVARMEPIGSFDTYMKDADANKFAEGEKDEKSFAPITLNKGTYYVVFSKSGENSALEGNTASRCIQLRGLTLTEAPPDVKVEKVTYDFRKGPYNKGVDNVVDYSLTENWKFHSMEEELWEKYKGSYKFARFLNYGIQFQSGADEWLALTLNIPSSGFYIPDFKYAMGPSGSMGDIYLAPATLSSNAWFDDAYHIGQVDFHCDGELTKDQEKELLSFKVNAAGEYVLVLKSRKGALYPTSLTLTSAEVTGAEVLFEEEYLRVGATEKVSMKIATSKDRYVDVIGAVPTFKSSNESIATMAADGTIVGVGEGTVTITAETTVYGKKLVGSKTIEVKNISYSHADVNITEGEAFFVGNRKELTASGYFSDGSEIKPKDITARYESSNENVVKIEDGVLCAEGEGEAKITAYVKFGEEEKSVERTVKVERVKLSYITAKTEDNVVSSFDADGSKIIVTGTNNDGSVADISEAVYSYESLTPDTVSVNENGYARYISRGDGKVKVSVLTDDGKFECECVIIPSSHKTKPTVYTQDMRETALKNAAKYEWAKQIKANTVKDADKYLANIDFIYDHIPGEGIPRSNKISMKATPTEMQYTCPHPECKADIRADFGSYGWGVDPVARPWKVQCPKCKRLFPSNDFESFYKLGLQPDGTFDHEVAMQKNAEIVAAGGKGYLVNETYADMPEDWLVDDGFGWSLSEGYGTQIRTDKLCPVAYYMHWIWGMNGTTKRSFITMALNTLRDAYLYTGDVKYGRAGAILTDRIADVYPTYVFESTSINYGNAHGSRNAGKIVGTIWEAELAEMFIRAYDAFYPMFDDKEVISYLSAKSTQFGQENPKTSGDMIRENCENGILREAFKNVKNGKIWGNFGMHQLTVALAAAALDTYPETGEMLEWLGAESKSSSEKTICPIYGSTHSTTNGNTGGGILIKYVQDVDRDGFGSEVAVGYNRIWTTDGLSVAEVLYRYGAEGDLNLFENPKYVKMYNTFIKETAGDGYTLQFGDSGGTASAGLYSTADETLRAYYMLGDPRLAQNYYYTVGGKLDDVYIDMFTNNDGLKERIEEDIDKYGELKFESENLTGFGLAMMRGGEFIKGAGAGREHRYDTWMYYGITDVSHSHKDMLHLGIDAYGFNFMPDLGYPEATSSDPNRMQWVNNTLSHNTVSVNGLKQTGISGGNPLHFDDAGMVKVIDSEAKGVYEGVNIYRRTAVTVEESAEVAYTVDFFRVKGGDKHTYSFHTQSYMGYSTDDFTLAKQVDENGNYVGSYAGADVPYGKDPNTPEPATSDCETMYPRGYTWLENVNRAENLTNGNFSVNFKQTDFNKQVADSKDLNLKYTALNDWTPSEVAITTGYAPRVSGNKNVPGLDYMLIHREGSALDTLFTSVLQPYKGEEYIKSMEAVVPVIKNGTPGADDTVKAIKVALKNGRTDYIIYATNNAVTYTVADADISFDFRGFVGVYSVNAKNENIYSYINDGDIIGDTSAVAEYTGEVVDFTKALSSENSITVKFEGKADVENLTNRYIYVANDGVQNGAYRIISASPSGDNVVLNMGDVSIIRGFVDTANLDAGYIYNIAEGQKFSIPLSMAYDGSPIFDDISDNLTTSAGSSISVNVNAKSPSGEAVTYSGNVLPRGASLNSQTGVVTWKPDASQVGESGFMITAVDASGRKSAVTFEVTVYGSTTSKPSDTTEAPSNGTTDAPAGGGGGGGAAPTDKPEDNKTNNGGESGENGGNTDNTGTENGNLRFTDLENHAWAADAINALAEDGIIKGTSASTFDPSSNITRADFASLLVRAFKLESDNTENFADASASDYFASELAIARNNGIISGIGDNKFAPRKPITRQDMMVIVYRALQTLNVGFGIYDEPQYEDYSTVADYAKEAVFALVSAGFVNGKNGHIAPTDFTTRAEVAVLLKRILKNTQSAEADR